MLFEVYLIWSVHDGALVTDFLHCTRRYDGHGISTAAKLRFGTIK